MLGAAEALINASDIELAVATVSNRVDNLRIIEGKRIRYYLISSGNKYSGSNTTYNKKFEKQWKIIDTDFNPDIIHIHGTENTHGLAYMRACGNEKCVVSIQGMMSAYDYYDYGLTKKQIMKNLSLSDILRCNSIFSAKRSFRNRSKYEREMIQRTHHVIGRTDWDKARTWAINPIAEYHFNNETLRSEFYTNNRWNYNQCIKHSIFLSQGSYPIKGLHQILKALPLVLQFYPDTVVRIAGKNIIKRPKGLRELYFYSGYGNVIREIIKDKHLDNCVLFLGNLGADQMRSEYLNANLFICPSTIENSPNSLGEAQILGVPCLASYVGGTMNMISSSLCGELYRFEEVEMLAWKICKLFETSASFDNSTMIDEAKNRHDREKNATELLDIYSSIINERIK